MDPQTSIRSGPPPVPSTFGECNVCRLSAAALLGFYATSFVLPAAGGAGLISTKFGYDVFVETLDCAVSSPYDFRWTATRLWLANPLFWSGVVALSLQRPLLAATCGMVALFVMGGDLFSLRGEGLLRIGAYLWYGTIMALFVVGLVAAGHQELQKPDPNAKRSRTTE
jgi:hypothetical protein